MTTPAQRYAAARRRGQYPALSEFRAGYQFALDDFQVESCEALEDGYGVLVCAPTGAGKTVVGEFAVHLALTAGQKCFYTTPIKALSNQKFSDLVARHGAETVGLLTGDNAVNPDAQVIVMTTEVLRNMLYVGSPALADLGYVVMDEVHYLGDRFRGAVWEEAIIHLPASVRLASLSATVSNAEEFGEWLMSVRGHTKVVVHEVRPVPLWQHMLVGNRMFDLFGTGTSVDHELVRFVNERMRTIDPGAFGRNRSNAMRRPPRGWRPPDRPDVINRLDREGLLPAITFIFSRAGCEAALRQCVQSGMWLTTPEEREQISAIVEERTANIPADDLEVLGYWEWLDGLRRGVAAHHAGMVPAFKEVVETLFIQGLVRAVFATETLALGINMPARSVVLERLSKFNGETHADITPGEYTQLTGRAGRRGIDVEGHAVVLWSPEVDPLRVAGLASTRTYPLRSSFRPSYNMAVNLVGQLGRVAGRRLLESSFAQFQADRSVSGLARQIRKNDDALAEYQKKMACHLGDFAEYAALRRQLSEAERQVSRSGARARQGELIASMEKLAPGDVVRVPRGRRHGLAIIIDAGVRLRDDPRPLVLTEARWSGRLSPLDFAGQVEVVGRVRVPKNFNYRSPQERRDLASTLRTLNVPPEPKPSKRRDADDDALITSLRAELRSHPCHACADREEHARWSERYAKLMRENESIRRKIDGRTGSLGRAFDQICALLDERGYLDGDNTTAAGQLLARIWSDSDLVVAECLQSGAWDGLDAPELAAVVSTLVYEARREERAVERLPTSAVRDSIGETVRIWAGIADAESEHGLVTSREPELGFAWAAYRWTRKENLDRVLESASAVGSEMSAGDFVRWCKQLVDLLEQIASSVNADGKVASAARQAISAIRRGVVAQGMSA